MDRYNVKIEAKITTTNGDPFCDNFLEYHNLGYTSLVELEKRWADFYESLADLGISKAKEKMGMSNQGNSR